MKRTLLALTALLTVIGMLWAGYFQLGGTGKRVPSASQQREALYATALPDIDGRLQALQQWRGKVLVVNYWATWCLPCRDEMPAFSALQTRFAARGVQFVGIANDEPGKVREFARLTPVTYPLLIGNFDVFGMTVDLGNAAMGLPFTIVLDREGKMRASVLGRMQEHELTSLLDGLV